ncbi:hypothetical protein HHI36_000983 [Cryptolaemus montrouzieri]|uniref:Uncharacterized protein n=1 Tax=Cryptolaemus montrouzieri TaxID=559131 RepID=A0ABD2P6A6_9CUCU
MPRLGKRVAVHSNTSGNGHLVKHPVRKQRLEKSKEELEEKAAEVLRQAEKFECVTSDNKEPDNVKNGLSSRASQKKSSDRLGEFTLSQVSAGINQAMKKNLALKEP